MNLSSAIGFASINLKKGEESLVERISSQKLKTDFNELRKWRFFSKEIKTKDDIWTAEKLTLTNDPFNKPQLIINNKKFSSFDKNGEILVKSKWSIISLEYQQEEEIIR